jgi:hypothetical protein
MKFTVTFKTPYAMEDRLKQVLGDGIYHDGSEPVLNGLGKLNEYNNYVHECLVVSEKFIYFGEIVTIEFDSEAKTATVLPVKGS